MNAHRPSILKIAPPYDAELIDRIAKGFSKKLGVEVQFEVVEDRSLLCGFIAYVNGTVYDVSGKVHLAGIREHLVDAVIVPQSAEIEAEEEED